jgi:hypothetical protein
MRFTNITVRNLDPTSGTAIVLAGAYRCSIDGLQVRSARNGFVGAPGESMFYRRAPASDKLVRNGNIAVRNIVIQRLGGAPPCSSLPAPRAPRAPTCIHEGAAGATVSFWGTAVLLLTGAQSAARTYLHPRGCGRCYRLLRRAGDEPGCEQRRRARGSDTQDLRMESGDEALVRERVITGVGPRSPAAQRVQDRMTVSTASQISCM